MLQEHNKYLHSLPHDTTDLFKYIWKSLDEDDKSYFFNDYQSFCTFFENVGQKIIEDNVPEHFNEKYGT